MQICSSANPALQAAQAGLCGSDNETRAVRRDCLFCAGEPGARVILLLLNFIRMFLRTEKWREKQSEPLHTIHLDVPLINVERKWKTQGI